MSATAKIEIHPSAFPDAVSRSLLDSIRAKALAPRFLYEGTRQTQKWLRLHEQFSPARTDTEVQTMYGRAFEETANLLTRRDTPESSQPKNLLRLVPSLPEEEVEVISLGCGSGAKDYALIQQLIRAGKQVFYTPMDISVGMVLTAREAALKLITAENCRPVVCDLGNAPELVEVIRAGQQRDRERRTRIVTAFGLLPTFEPNVLLPVISGLGGCAEVVLLSANLAPGNDYAAGVAKVLPEYDNALTRDWLLSALKELDIWSDDGELDFGIEEDEVGLGLQRIVARFRFRQEKTMRNGEDELVFRGGEGLRVFFSYRHTPELVGEILKRHGMRVEGQWISGFGEEGVFLVRGGNVNVR